MALPPAALAGTVAFGGRGMHGALVTPHLFTTTEELDQLVRALRALAA